MHKTIEHFSKPIKVLDHGFIQLVDLMGNDDTIVEAARVSYDPGSTTKTRDARGLIRYLVRHQHSSPLEMCEAKFIIKAPIFIARQFVRHRTASWNEISGRYSELPEDSYVPEVRHICQQDTVNRQGSGESLDETMALKIQQSLRSEQMLAQKHYHEMLNRGVARETARINLPLSRYTQWYWKIDLRNLLHFIQLRMDPHAQREIQEYAKVLFKIVQHWIPLTAEAFQDYVLDAVTFSGPEAQVLKKLLNRSVVEDLTDQLTLDTSPSPPKLSKGETVEFSEKLRKLS